LGEKDDAGNDEEGRHQGKKVRAEPEPHPEDEANAEPGQ